MAYREFADAGGTRWQAWDTRPRSKAEVRARYAGGWLSFESAGERRRLHPIPDGWAEAHDQELRDWLGAAEGVTPATLGGQRPVARRAASRGTTLAEAAASASADDAARAGALWQATEAVLRRARAVIQLVNVTTGSSRDEGADPKP